MFIYLNFIELLCYNGMLIVTITLLIKTLIFSLGVNTNVLLTSYKRIKPYKSMIKPAN